MGFIFDLRFNGLCGKLLVAFTLLVYIVYYCEFAFDILLSFVPSNRAYETLAMFGGDVHFCFSSVISLSELKDWFTGVILLSRIVFLLSKPSGVLIFNCERMFGKMYCLSIFYGSIAILELNFFYLREVVCRESVRNKF